MMRGAWPAKVLPPDIRGLLVDHPQRAHLLEVPPPPPNPPGTVFRRYLDYCHAPTRLASGVNKRTRHGAITSKEGLRVLQVVLDLGRRPEARFQGMLGGEFLRDEEVRGFPCRLRAPGRPRAASTRLSAADLGSCAGLSELLRCMILLGYQALSECGAHAVPLVSSQMCDTKFERHQI